MKRFLNLKSRAAIGASLAMLMALLCMVPNAQAKLGDPNDPKWTRPEKPTVTTPKEGSRLTDERYITVSGTGLVNPRVGGWRFYNVAGTITATHVQNGKRVRATAWGQTKGFSAVTDKTGKWENRRVELPKLETGWRDVIYEFKITQGARPERNDHPTLEVNPLHSVPLIFQVKPYKQPASGEGQSGSQGTPPATGGTSTGSDSGTYIPAPKITSPRAGARLPNTSRIDVSGTGTAGYHITLMIQTHYTPADGGARKQGKTQNTEVLVSNQERWEKKNWELPALERGWTDVTYRISAAQRSAFKAKDQSGTTRIEVQPNQQPGPLTMMDRIGPAIDPKLLPKLPDGLSDRVVRPIPGLVLHSKLAITSPSNNEKVNSRIRVRGTATERSQIRVNVTLLSPARAQRGKRPSTSRIDLGTFTAKANSKGEWRTTPINLNPGNARPGTAYEIAVTEIYPSGQEGTTAKIKVLLQ